MAVMLAGACVGAWTSKQKIVTKSSTEAEVVGLTDGLGHALWARHWMEAQGYTQEPTAVYQDNEGGPSNRIARGGG